MKTTLKGRKSSDKNSINKDSMLKSLLEFLEGFVFYSFSLIEAWDRNTREEHMIILVLEARALERFAWPRIGVICRGILSYTSCCACWFYVQLQPQHWLSYDISHTIHLLWTMLESVIKRSTKCLDGDQFLIFCNFLV